MAATVLRVAHESAQGRELRESTDLVMKHQILFIAANPSETERLALPEECAAIERAIDRTAGRDQLDLRSKWAVSVDDLMQHLNASSSAILHFSVHGTSEAQAGRGDGVYRDFGSAQPAGILLQEGSAPQRISAAALADLISTTSPSTRLVVLNACHSAAVAETLCEKIDCVVGMDGPVADEVARSFAVAFYRALGHGRSVGNAFKQGLAALGAKQQPSDLPVCRTRDGVSADQLFLVEPRLDGGESGPQPPGPDEHDDVCLLFPAASKATAHALRDLLRPDVRVAPAPRASDSGDRIATRATVLLLSRQAEGAWFLGEEIMAAIAAHQAAPSALRLIVVALEPKLSVPRGLAGAERIEATALGGLAGVAARLRQMAPAIRARPPHAWKPAGRARRDHFRVYDRLCELSGAVVEQVASRAGVARDRFAPATATVAERALDLAQLAALDWPLCCRLIRELDSVAPVRRRL